MASGVGGLPADCVPAPRPSGLLQRETKVVERLETLRFAEVCGPSMRDCREGHDSLKEGLPGKGRGAGEGVSRCFKACPQQTMDGLWHEATGWISAASTRHWPNWQAGRQASKQIVRDAAGWRVKFGIIPRRKPDVA